MVNENDNRSFFQRNWKQLLLALTAIFIVFYVAVFASVWGDRNYKTDFWPDFFKWSAIVIGGGMFVIWLISWIAGGRKR